MRALSSFSVPLLFSLSSVLVSSCGAASGDGGSKEDGALLPAGDGYSVVVQNLAGLPACDASTVGRLAYVQESQSFQSCGTAGWAAIDIKGAQGTAGVAGAAGADGSEGAAGKDGADGADGTNNRIEASIFCSGQLDADPYYFTYSVALMTSGDVFSSGDVAGGSFQVSSTAFYSAQQNGAATAPIYMTMDAVVDPNFGYWKISLDRDSLVTTIEYNDEDNVVDPMLWQMASEDCIINTYD